MDKSIKGITLSIKKALLHKDQHEPKEKEEVTAKSAEAPKKKRRMTEEERIIKYDLTKEEYRKQRYDLLTDKSLDALMSWPKLSSKVDYVADRYGVGRGEAYARALKLYKNYDISVTKFAKEDFFGCKSEEEILEKKELLDKKRQRKLNTLMTIMDKDIEEVKEYVEEMRQEYGVGLSKIIDNELFKLEQDEIIELLENEKKENAARKEKIKKANDWNDFEFERSVTFCKYRYNIFSLKIYDNLDCYKYPREVLDTFAVPKDSKDMSSQYNTVSTKVISNKIDFDLAFSDFLGRKFWINKDTSIEEFKEFTDGLTRVFCKPINLCGGHGCYRYDLTGDIEKDYEYFMNEVLMIIEEIPEQHHLISEIYPNSIDTVRVTAVLKDDKFIPINSWIKFGAKGSVVDGRVGGGCFAAVNVKTGIVETPAIDYDNNRFTNHVDTGKPITGFQIPYWDEVLDLAERALRHIDGINFVGWDICVTENGPVIIEGNSGPAFADIQLLYTYEGHEGEGQRWRYYDLLEDPDKWRRI